MKVIAIVGSSRKKHTYHAVEDLLQRIHAYGNVEYDIIRLNEYRLGVCSGCKLCLDRGEELCPLRDDRDILLDKMMCADGVIFASPNYSFHVSGQMKIFLDRLGFIFHRPQFFGKTFTSIVAQGVFGGSRIVKYFDFIGNALGFNVVKGISVTNLEPVSDKAVKKNERRIEKLSRRFHKKLMNPVLPNPNLFELFIFRMARTSMSIKQDETFRDFQYYNAKGWFASDFYYPVKLSPAKKYMGKLFDAIVRKTT